MFQSLARLKEEFLKTKIGGSSPDVSTLSIPQEKLTTASQTDLRGEVTRCCLLNEPRLEKTSLPGSQTGQTQTCLYRLRKRPERNCTICVAETKALIS